MIRTQGGGWARHLALPHDAWFLRLRDIGGIDLTNHHLGRFILDLSVTRFRISATFRVHLLRLRPLHGLREVVRDAQIKRGGFELNLVSHEFGPLVPSGVDPAHEVEVVDVF